MVTEQKLEVKSFPFPSAGLGLLIIQPSAFCNINCDYCYLPDRTSHKRMSTSVLTQAIQRVIGGGLGGEKLSIVWHAGEPLALPLSFYEEAFAAINSLPIGKATINNSMQSNGMLINDEWCAFIKANNVRLGLSIDGPAFIHDAHRKTRSGKGTHAQVMKGVEILRRHEIDFHVIAVITEQALGFPDEIFQFFAANEMHRVGFNIEELEGVNLTSTLMNDSVEQRVNDFFRRIYSLQKESNGFVQIREFDRAYQAIAQATINDPLHSPPNDQVAPFAIISVAYDGSISTFSPELLGMKNSEYGDFYFGNVMTDDLSDVAASGKFQHVLNDIQTGVQLCSDTCEYFSFCGGGAPSNKYYENGSFASAETMFCRHTIKTPIDIVLEDLEQSLGIQQPTSVPHQLLLARR